MSAVLDHVQEKSFSLHYLQEVQLTSSYSTIIYVYLCLQAIVRPNCDELHNLNIT